MSYVIVYGNAFDGLAILGTFEDEEDAAAYAEIDRVIRSEPWHIVFVEPKFEPDEKE